MKQSKPQQSAGREKNAAQPLGESTGLHSNKDRAKTGERSRRAAGPDGPDASAVGDTFKGH